MNHFVLLALAATLGTWLVTALGAATVVFFTSPSPKALNLMLGFASGVMIAASFWSLLQPAIERAEALASLPADFVATAGFLFGAVFMWVSDKAVTFATGRANSPQGARGDRLNRIIMLGRSITLHNIPEGLAVGVAFGALQNGCTSESFMGAVSVAVGIGLQNFPEGAAVSVPLLQGVWHIHIQTEIWREHAFIGLQHVKIRTWALPEPLELVIVYEEVAPEVCLVCRLGRLRVIEALKVARPLHLYRR